MEGEDYRDLLTRLSTALAMTEAAYLEANRSRLYRYFVEVGYVVQDRSKQACSILEIRP
jgi:hypothetical protein